METNKSKMGPSLAEVAQRLERWRKQRGGHGRRIPEELWSAIVEAAKAEDIGTTVRVLGVKKEQLERRLVGHQGAAGSNAAAIGSRSRIPAGGSAGFVEVDSQRVFSGGQMTVRLTNRAGERVEIALSGTMAEAMEMVQALWGRERCSS